MKKIRRILLRFLKIFLEKNYSKVIFGIIFFSVIAYSAMFILRIPLQREFFVISLITLVLVLRNEFYWWLYKLGYFVEIKLKKFLDYESTYMDSKNKEMVMTIVNSAFELAENHTGALITFERHNPLVDYYSNAIILNSDISVELMLSIFNTKSPLHDGGLIISNNRIKAAGCFYPISKRQNIRKDLGSRHRAALGLSEITDSLTVLVSEEKGKVFIVSEGVISTAIEQKAQLYDLILDRLN